MRRTSAWRLLDRWALTNMDESWHIAQFRKIYHTSKLICMAFKTGHVTEANARRPRGTPIPRPDGLRTLPKLGVLATLTTRTVLVQRNSTYIQNTLAAYVALLISNNLK